MRASLSVMMRAQGEALTHRQKNVKVGTSRTVAMQTVPELVQVPWDALSQSVYGDMAWRASSSHSAKSHPADAEILSALEHREEARVRVLNALERAGATPNTVRQVEEAMDRRSVKVQPDELQAYRQSWKASARGADALASYRYVLLRSVPEHACLVVPPGEPPRRASRVCLLVGRASCGEQKAGLGCNLQQTVEGHHVVYRVMPGGEPSYAGSGAMCNAADTCECALHSRD